MRLQVLETAREDLVDGFHFYENKEENLGRYFIASLYSDIESLKILAGIHPQVYKDYYRALSKNFPFGIYHTLEAQTVLVRAVVVRPTKPLMDSQAYKKYPNRPVQLIAGPCDFRSPSTVITRSGTGPAKSRAGRVPSFPIHASHPPPASDT